MKTKHKILKQSGGFTVLESIIAILVLSLSVSGVFSAVQQGLSQSIISKDEVKAFYLAQEAVEIIRNKRDTNQIARISNPSLSWLAGISGDINDPCYFGQVCRVDVTAAYQLQRCTGDCGNLKQDPTNFLYGYVSGNEANFKREVTIESVNANEIAVTVKISWTKGSLLPMEFKAKTHLFKWI